MEASVRSFKAADVLRTLAALKLAASNTMEVVVAQITPAIPIGPAAYAMIRFDGTSLVVFFVVTIPPCKIADSAGFFGL
jgi:hypothetical protein